MARALVLACLLPLLVASVARAQSPVPEAPTWVAQELLWVSSSVMAARTVGLPQAVMLPAADLPPLDLVHAGQRGRYHTMKLAGTVLTMAAITLGFVAIPLETTRHEHQRDYGRGSCGPDVFPYLGAAALAAGLTVGLIGGRREDELTRKHPAVPPLRSRWRAALAGLGVGTAIGMLAASLSTTALCNS